jgi:hypothetical protein
VCLLAQQDELIALIKKLTLLLEGLVKSGKIAECEPLLIERQNHLEELVAQLDRTTFLSNSNNDIVRSLLVWVKAQDAPMIEKLINQKVGVQQKLLNKNRASQAINKYRDNI